VTPRVLHFDATHRFCVTDKRR